MRKHRMGYHLLSLLLFTSWTVCGQQPAERVNDATRRTLLELVNQMRSAACLCGDQKLPKARSVVWDDRLEAAALQHALDLFHSNHLSHKGSDGTSPADRTSRSGFVWKRCCENIAQGFDTPEAVMTAWRMSPPHCRNLMDSTIQRIAIARCGSFWVMEGATPR
ncbi:MAG: CAP domain-containing protein [Marinilabiliales bacterium]|nr:CAP domain-containing protein [Marinilabiliales bacterium]